MQKQIKIQKKNKLKNKYRDQSDESVTQQKLKAKNINLEPSSMFDY